jgi:hypothetical protein
MRGLLTLAALLIVLAVSYWIIGTNLAWFKPTTPISSQSDNRAASAHHTIPREVLVDAKPITSPEFVEADYAPIEDDEVVIGVLIENEPRAYLRDAFDDHPANHVVLDRVGSLNIVVTHCDMNRCTRILAGAEGKQPAVRVGGLGWTGNEREMLLLVEGERYVQSSLEIPLEDVPFVETTWGLWREVYPETLVYVRPPESTIPAGF